MTETIAQQLKKIRIEKSISLEDIAYKTHVRLDYLEAIEAEEAGAILSPIQIKGFLRLYANEIGVNLEKLQESGNNPSKDESPDTAESGEKNNRKDHNATLENVSGVDIPEEQNEDLSDQKTQAENSIKQLPSHSIIENKRVSSKIFSDIGHSLRSRRELISLSINDIYENIHVRKEHLSTIEAGEFHKLPSNVQAKGMLQNYAEFLGLDVDAVLLLFSEALQLQRLERQQASGQKNRVLNRCHQQHFG